MYGPEVCAFVDPSLNMFTTDSAAARGEWPIGVCFHKRVKKFSATIGNPFTKKQEYKEGIVRMKSGWNGCNRLTCSDTANRPAGRST